MVVVTGWRSISVPVWLLPCSELPMHRPGACTGTPAKETSPKGWYLQCFQTSVTGRCVVMLLLQAERREQ